MKNTKRSLFFSVLALMLCVSMLLSSTYAWFTDTAVSSGNRIVSGRLDIEVYWSEALNGPWHNMEEERYNTVFSYERWEPGYTELRYFRIVNKGSLSLKYQFGLEPAGKVGKIADVIDLYYTDDASLFNSRGDIEGFTPAGTLSEVMAGLSSGALPAPNGTLLPAGELTSSGESNGEAVCALALQMQKSAGNEYQNETIGDGFYITVLATQASYEADSFDEYYDEDAGFPALSLPVLASSDIETDGSGIVTHDTVINEGGEISAVIPAGTAMEPGTESAVLSVTLVSESGNVSASGGTASRVLDIHVSGLAADNTVPVIITVKNALPAHLELGTLCLYHTENGVQNLMERKQDAASVTAHNDYFYSSTDGSVVMALSGFSNILFEVDNSPENIKWNGDSAQYSGKGTQEAPYVIYTSNELAKLAQDVSGGNSFEGKYIVLENDIVINNWIVGNKDYNALDFASSDTNDPAFDNNGTNDPDKAFKPFPTIGSYDNGDYRPFEGHFDGKGHTVSGLFHLYYDDPMEKSNIGLFGMVEGSTIKNLTIADSFFYTYGGMIGMVATRAYGKCLFENIRITGNFATQYNYYLGGIVGYIYSGGDTEVTLKDCYVDNTNTFEALWGTYDAAVGGLVGAVGAKNFDTAPTVTISNCTVFPTVSLYNDCCANYQWFAYRYSGMLIGYVNASDRAQYLGQKVRCSDTVVKYGSWTDMYYCEFVSQGHPSYCEPHDWKYRRLGTDEYYYNEGSGKYVCTHDHSSAGGRIGSSFEFKDKTYEYSKEDENNACVYLPFDQLFGGGQGVYGETVSKYAEYLHKTVAQCGVTVISNGQGGADLGTKFVNKNKYLYRVGNRNPVSLGTIFTIEGSDIRSDAVKLTAEKITGVTCVDYTADSNNWANGTLSFTGTGVIRLKLEYLDSEPVELCLEVVDAVNATTAVSATSNNVVLVKDVSVGGNASIKIDNGYSFYGNGFKVNCTGNGSTNSSEGMGSGYITIAGGGTLDNTQVIAPDFPKAYMYVGETNYDYYLRESENTIDSNHFGYQLSAVKAEGRARISNCYIYGARNNVLAQGGELTIDNCVLANGSLSNIHFNSPKGILNIHDVTTIQYYRKFDYNAPNGSGQKHAKVIGFGVLMGPTPEGTTPESNPVLNITGEFNQYNWVCNDYTDITSSKMAKSLIETGLNQSAFVHQADGKNYINMGVVYLNNLTPDINDSRTDHGYKLESVSMSVVTGQVYSLQASSGTVSILDSGYSYSGYKNGLYIPHYTIHDLSTTSPDENEKTYCWNDNGTIRIKISLGDKYDLNVLDHISFSRYTDERITTSVSCIGGTVDGNVVSFSSAGSKEIIITVTGSEVFDLNGSLQGTQNYVLSIPVEVIAVDTSWKDAKISCSSDTGTILYQFNSSRDFTYGVPIFEGMTIVDYDENGNEYTVLDGNNQTTFLNNIASIVTSDDNKTGFTINFPDGTKISIACSAPYHSQGNLAYKKYNNKFYMSGSKNLGSANYTQTQKISSYTYTGRSGTPVVYNTPRTFTGTTPKMSSTGISFSNLSTNKFLMYDAQGGTVSPTYTGTSPATLPTPTREGYTFLNWNTKADGTGTARNAGTSMSFSSTTTLYAIWAKNIKVSFKSDGTTISTVSGGAGTANTLPTATDTFNWLEGWYTEETGGTKIGNSGASFTIPASDTTYYAHWSPKYYVVYDMSNGGTVTADYNYEGKQADIYEGKALTLPTPTNGSMTFEGWYTAESGGTKVGAAGDSYTPTADITLYAQWSNNILVTFNGNGGTAGTNSATYDHVTPITLPTATWAGHQFNGWYTAASGGTKVGNAGASYAPTANITLYAQWTAYTVSFDGNGATNPSSLTAGSNGTVTLPTPTRTGYTFNGWYTDATGGTNVGNAGDSYTPTEATTLYAQWTVNTYKVTITTSNSSTAVTVNGTTVSNGGSVAYNSVVKVVLSYSQTNSLTFTIKQGNTNVTYYSNEACTSSTTSTAAGTYYFKMPAGDVTINSSSSSGCVTPDTLVTMADGTYKPISEINSGDMLLAWDFYNGRTVAAPVVFNDGEPEELCDVIRSIFSDGTEVDVIYEHGFFDVDLGKFVYFDNEASQYIGHRFIKQKGEESQIVTLTDVIIEQRMTTAFDTNTYEHLCFYTNDMLSISGGISGLFNIFEVDTGTMTYDPDKMQADIDTYGLLSYDAFENIVPYSAYCAFNGRLLGIAMAKGLLTQDDINYLADRYKPYF